MIPPSLKGESWRSGALYSHLKGTADAVSIAPNCRAIDWGFRTCLRHRQPFAVLKNTMEPENKTS